MTPTDDNLRKIMAAPAGEPPVLQWMAPDRLNVDEAYQRSIDNRQSQALIRRIAMQWGRGLCQPLTVAIRDSGALIVVDGQHRLNAARLRGDIAHLPCFIARYNGVEKEADTFVRLNRRRKPISAIEMFHAAVASGDADATVIARLINQNGLIAGRRANLAQGAPNTLVNYGGLTRMLAQAGEIALDAALDLLAQAFKDERLVYAGTIMPGIVAIATDELERDPNFTQGERFGLVTTMLAASTQREWYSDILQQGTRHLIGASQQVLRTAWKDFNDD